ncbi:hypothetical protein A2U01_0093135, partial [Trifolium medium]|nr:hypothetical protein [Trifolium medium]
MTKSTRSTYAKNKEASSPPDEVLFSNISEAKLVSTVHPQKPKKMRTK